MHASTYVHVPREEGVLVDSSAVKRRATLLSRFSILQPNFLFTAFAIKETPLKQRKKTKLLLTMH